MLEAVNPATGEVVRRVPTDDEAGVERKVAAAAAAAPDWGRRSFAERGALLRGVAAALRADRDRLAGLMTEEMGKTVREARGEIEKSATCAEHYAEHAEGYLAPRDLPSDATHSYVQHLPLGPILGILPWNSPFWLAFRFAAPALMAGNTCLMKHDPHVPGCAEALAGVFAEAGAPEGVFDALFLETPAVEAVIRDGRIRGVSFTGSTRGGSAVAAVAAETIKPAVLELGGSDPALVLADADLDKAVEVLALSRLIATGQSCIAAKRLLVEDAVHDDFVERLEAHIRGLTLGDPTDPATDIGPMAREDLRAALHGQVTRTIEEGATCRVGGTLPDGPGCFYPPTLLTKVTNDMTACREETFGPVAVVVRVGDEAEAVRVANDTPYGLAASVWSDADRGEALARRLDTGQVAVNGIVKTDPRLPSGGTKQSGYGKELGPHGIHEFVNAQQVWKGPARSS